MLYSERLKNLNTVHNHFPGLPGDVPLLIDCHKHFFLQYKPMLLRGVQKQILAGVIDCSFHGRVFSMQFLMLRSKCDF